MAATEALRAVGVATLTALLCGCYSDDVLAVKRANEKGCLRELVEAVARRGAESCAPLVAPSGSVICVGPERAADLPAIVAEAASDTTILLADGTYKMSGAGASKSLDFKRPRVTLRSASADRGRVILDGEYITDEMIRVGASDITISDVTIQHALHHAIHAVPPTSQSIAGLRLYGLHVVDAGNRLIKIDSSPGNPNAYVDNGTLACSTLELTAEGRERIQPTDVECDTGGINASQVRGWVVRDTTFRGIYCPTGGVAQHAIHFWAGSRDTLVERNTVVDCARGVGFGGDPAGSRSYEDDPYPGVQPLWHFAGIIRNNLIFAKVAQFDTGIELAQARGTKVFHNTIFHPEDAFSSLDYRYANTLVDLKNNIVVRLTSREQGQAEQTNNLEAAGADLFADALAGDLHLAATATAAIDQGLVLPEAGDDIDGFPHAVGLPDIGADESGAP